MTVQDYLRVGRERWKLIALVTLAGTLAAVALFLARPPEYTANLSLYVSAQVGDNPQQAYQGAQLSEQRVKSYTELVTGDRVMTETIQTLKLDQTSAQLAKKVTATSAIDSVIISVEATDRSPQTAAAIANTIGIVTTEVVADLERPTAPNGNPPVAVRIVQPAPFPLQPSSTGLPTLLALGLITGLFVGYVAALIKNMLDTSVKSLDALAAASGAPNLGTVPFDSKVPNRPLTVHDDPQSPRAEAFRQLRTNLQFIDVDRPRKIVVVTSSVPAEGKTTTVANLAIALSAANEHVLVIEADMRRPRLSDLLDVDRAAGLSQVLAGKLPFSRAVQTWAGTFDILPSGRTPPNPSELLGSNQMIAVLDEARANYDVVLIDSPPLLPVADTAAFASTTDGAVLVCHFKRTTRAQLEAAARTLRAVSVKPLGTVLTMVPAKGGPLAYGSYESYYSEEPTNTTQGDGRATTGTSMPASRSVVRPRHPQGASPPQGPQATAPISARRRDRRL